LAEARFLAEIGKNSRFVTPAAGQFSLKPPD
jgi:hypothetical protein